MCLVRVFVIGFKEFIFQVLWFSLHFRSLFRHFRPAMKIISHWQFLPFVPSQV